MSDQLTAAEKFEIRRWAWEQSGSFRIGDDGTVRLAVYQQIKYADDLAAWAMSGVLPGGSK